MTTHVTGFARSAAVKLQTEVISGPRAVVAVAIACFAIPTRPAAMLLRALTPLIDAVNIDLKGFTPEWYRRLDGDLETVKRSIALAAERCHVEVTTLLVPGENDSEGEIRYLTQWLASIDQNIPLHLSRFFPQYRMMDRPPTPVERVYHLAGAAREYLSFVYTGNC